MAMNLEARARQADRAAEGAAAAPPVRPARPPHACMLPSGAGVLFLSRPGAQLPGL